MRLAQFMRPQEVKNLAGLSTDSQLIQVSSQITAVPDKVFMRRNLTL
jgi:hypothetical protein